MDALSKCVSDALHHLYDFAVLARHPLGEVLGLDERTRNDRAQHLRRILLEGVDSMRPEYDVPSDAVDWRLYHILRMRYIDGLTADEAMRKLALQKSQFFHDQQLALQAIAHRLWERYQSTAWEEGLATDVVSPSEGEIVQSEAERLCDGAALEMVDVGQLLAELGDILGPLAQSHRVPLAIKSQLSGGTIKASRVPLRQAILHAASYALDLCPGGQMEVAPYADARQRGIRVRICSRGAEFRPEVESVNQRVRLNVAQQLLATMGGQLVVHSDCNLWEALLTCDASDLPMLLVVDDNQGVVDLLRRYMVGHGWQVLGASDGTDLRILVAETQPTVIILDVLMPQQDGWETLISLKTDERTSQIPVIVSSVLREAQIASSLGAASYLAKPVTEQALLHALSPWSPSVPTPS